MQFHIVEILYLVIHEHISVQVSLVAALFNYIKEDGTIHWKPQNSKIWSCKYVRLQWVILFIVALTLDKSGNSYQLLEFECNWKLSVDAISSLKASKHFPAQNHTGMTWKIYSILLLQGRIIPNPKQNLITGLSRGFCLEHNKIWIMHVQ